jgi:hypothetical protein
LTFVTAAPAPEQEASNLVASGFTAAEASDTKSAESAPTNNTGNLVAVLIARPEIKSLSDLAGKDVAIEGRRSASNATRVSERMCKQVSVSLPYRGDSHDEQLYDYT